MIFSPLALDGAFEIQIEPRGDARGLFARIFCEEEFARHKLNTSWAQMNISISAKAGTVRGLHFQRSPHAEVKLVRALRGRVFDIIVDLRAGSSGYGQHAVVTLDAEQRNAIYIPEGFAHGFQALTDNCELQYFHSAAYAPQAESGIQALDPALKINWPLPVSVRSGRDEALARLEETNPL